MKNDFTIEELRAMLQAKEKEEAEKAKAEEEAKAKKLAEEKEARYAEIDKKVEELCELIMGCIKDYGSFDFENSNDYPLSHLLRTMFF